MRSSTLWALAWYIWTWIQYSIHMWSTYQNTLHKVLYGNTHHTHSIHMWSTYQNTLHKVLYGNTHTHILYRCWAPTKTVYIRYYMETHTTHILYRCWAPTKTIYVRYYMETHTHKYTHVRVHTHTCTQWMQRKLGIDISRCGNTVRRGMFSVWLYKMAGLSSV